MSLYAKFVVSTKGTVTVDRSEGRIINIYNAQGHKEELGGLGNIQGITNKNFHDMLEILPVFHGPYTPTLASDDIFPKDGAELQPGKVLCRR